MVVVAVMVAIKQVLAIVLNHSSSQMGRGKKATCHNSEGIKGTLRPVHYVFEALYKEYIRICV
jgi:isopentenyldiphosphate isomerase